MTSADRRAFPNPRGKRRGRRCFVFAAVLLAGAAFGEEPLDLVIDGLAAEEAAVREKSERELVARGPRVLESLQLRKANCSWRDAEGNARLARAIERIQDDIAWDEAERVARKKASDRMCVHCRETAEVDVVRLRDAFLARSIRGARLVALYGKCCAEAANSWQLQVVTEDGSVADANFEQAGALLSRLQPVETAEDACRLASALEAATRAPGNFAEAWAEAMAGAQVELQDESRTRVQCGEIGAGRAYTFDGKGRLTRVDSLSW